MPSTRRMRPSTRRQAAAAILDAPRHHLRRHRCFARDMPAQDSRIEIRAHRVDVVNHQVAQTGLRLQHRPAARRCETDSAPRTSARPGAGTAAEDCRCSCLPRPLAAPRRSAPRARSRAPSAPAHRASVAACPPRQSAGPAPSESGAAPRSGPAKDTAALRIRRLPSRRSSSSIGLCVR